CSMDRQRLLSTTSRASSRFSGPYHNDQPVEESVRSAIFSAVGRTNGWNDSSVLFVWNVSLLSILRRKVVQCCPRHSRDIRFHHHQPVVEKESRRARLRESRKG